jgi:hypothetical protein
LSEEWEEEFAVHSPDNHSSDTSGIPPALLSLRLCRAGPFALKLGLSQMHVIHPAPGQIDLEKLPETCLKSLF